MLNIKRNNQPKIDSMTAEEIKAYAHTLRDTLSSEEFCLMVALFQGINESAKNDSFWREAQKIQNTPQPKLNQTYEQFLSVLY